MWLIKCHKPLTNPGCTEHPKKTKKTVENDVICPKSVDRLRADTKQRNLSNKPLKDRPTESESLALNWMVTGWSS